MRYLSPLAVATLLITPLLTAPTASAADETLNIACSANTARAGDIVTCEILPSDGWSWVDGQPEDGYLRIVDTDLDVIDIDGTTSGTISYSFVMPAQRDQVQTWARQYAMSDPGSGDLFPPQYSLMQKSPIITIERDPDPEPDMEWSCYPTIIRPGEDTTCNAVSSTGNGARIFADFRDSPSQWSETRPVPYGDWSTETFTVTAPETTGEYVITARLYDVFEETLLLERDATIIVTDADTTPDEPDTTRTPPAVEYAIPKVAELPCPDGWFESWQEWAAAPVCVLDATWDTSNAEYTTTYADAAEEVARYDARAAVLAQPTPREGSVVTTLGGQWVVTDTQKVFYLNARDVNLDSRDREVIERAYAGLIRNPSAIVKVSGFADSDRVRNTRIDSVIWRLTQRGIPGERIHITPGDKDAAPSGNRVDLAVLEPLFDGPRVS